MLLFLAAAAHALPDDAVRALRVGDCQTALQAGAHLAETGVEHLAIARCLVQLKRPAEALSTLDYVTQPELSAFVAPLRIEAWVQAGDHAAVIAASSPEGLPEPVAQRLATEKAKALLATGKTEQGRAMLDDLLQGPLGRPGTLAEAGGADPAEIRWVIAETWRGEPGEVAILQALWTHNPTSPEAERAEKRLAELGKHPMVNEALIRARIETLDELRAYPESLELRKGLMPGFSAATMAHASFKARQYEGALEYFADISSPSPYDRFQHALTTSRVGDYPTAAQRYQALIDAAPSDKWADFASFKLGYLDFDEGALDSAIPKFEAHLKRYPSSKHNAEARFFIAWSYYQLDLLDEADSAFSELVARHSDDERYWAGLYWQGRIAQDRGQTETAKDWFERVVKRGPSSGYAWFAARHLGRSWAAPAFEAQAPADIGPGWRTAMALAEVGLVDWARMALDGVDAGSRDERLTLAEARAIAGDYPGAQAIARRYCRSPSSSDKRACHSRYPRPAGSLVDSMLDGSGLPRHLPFGLMTAESALKPWVTSIAGARGLMQLMPEVAEGLHPQVAGDTPFSADNLYRPEYNAALGTTELLRLWNRYADQPEDVRIVATIAGYNGGHEAVDRWLEAHPEGAGGDVFAENVGYTETRKYVRRVLGHMQTYRQLYGD